MGQSPDSNTFRKVSILMDDAVKFAKLELCKS